MTILIGNGREQNKDPYQEPMIWTPSVNDRVHQNMERVHEPRTWTGSMEPQFYSLLLLQVQSISSYFYKNLYKNLENKSLL